MYRMSINCPIHIGPSVSMRTQIYTIETAVHFDTGSYIASFQQAHKNNTRCVTLPTSPLCRGS